MPYDRHKGSRNAMARTVNCGNIMFVARIMHPVKVAADNVLRHEEHKGVIKIVLGREHSPLYPLSVPDAGGDVPVFFFQFNALCNNLRRSLLYLLLKYFLFIHQFAFAYADKS